MKKIMISLAAAALACAAFTGCQKKGAGEGDAARSAGGKIELATARALAFGDKGESYTNIPRLLQSCTPQPATNKKD